MNVIRSAAHPCTGSGSTASGRTVLTGSVRQTVASASLAAGAAARPDAAASPASASPIFVADDVRREGVGEYVAWGMGGGAWLAGLAAGASCVGRSAARSAWRDSADVAPGACVVRLAARTVQAVITAGVAARIGGVGGMAGVVFGSGGCPVPAACPLTVVREASGERGRVRAVLGAGAECARQGATGGCSSAGAGDVPGSPASRSASQPSALARRSCRSSGTPRRAGVWVRAMTATGSRPATRATRAKGAPEQRGAPRPANGAGVTRAAGATSPGPMADAAYTAPAANPASAGLRQQGAAPTTSPARAVSAPGRTAHPTLPARSAHPASSAYSAPLASPVSATVPLPATSDHARTPARTARPIPPEATTPTPPTPPATPKAPPAFAAPTPPPKPASPSPAPARDAAPTRGTTSTRRPTPARDATLTSDTTPTRRSTLTRDTAPMRNTSPTRATTPARRLRHP